VAAHLLSAAGGGFGGGALAERSRRSFDGDALAKSRKTPVSLWRSGRRAVQVSVL
jgi:hypothetical protein